MSGAISEADLDALLMDAGERELSGFNIFEVMRSAHGELRHSNVLA